MAISISIVAAGRAPNSSETEWTLQYLERARNLGSSLGFSAFHLIEVDERKSGNLIETVKSLPGQKFALDPRGDDLSSEDFSQLILNTRDRIGAPLVFMIGGANGFSVEERQLARRALAFGKQTWPHMLVRVMLAEQIYRSMSIIAGHPYHRH